MTVYGDTSWWIAYKVASDVNHSLATRVFDRFPEIKIVWTPWQRIEVFTAFRQLERNGLIAAGKARESIRLLEQEVRLGYWPHVEFNWRNTIRRACELSAMHGLALPIRGMDLFHVAIAIEMRMDALATLDEEQLSLATAAELPTLSFSTRKAS
jgi:predicted nucleic acid-binding protein